MKFTFGEKNLINLESNIVHLIILYHKFRS